MILDPRRALVDAWALFRSERSLLLPIAGLFLFVPQLAQLLLLPEVPEIPLDRSPQNLATWFEGSYSAWATIAGPWILLGYLLVLFGSATILALFLDAGRLDVASALRRALGLTPRYLLASILIGIPVGIGSWLLVLPGIYLLGRLMLTGPAVMATPSVGAVRAAATSWRLTRRAQMATTALAALTMLAAMIAPLPFLSLASSMRAAGAVNPVALAMLEIGAAAAITASVLALLLVEIAVWRQLARR
jgi:hypothetical protein